MAGAGTGIQLAAVGAQAGIRSSAQKAAAAKNKASTSPDEGSSPPSDGGDGGADGGDNDNTGGAEEEKGDNTGKDDTKAAGAKPEEKVPAEKKATGKSEGKKPDNKPATDKAYRGNQPSHLSTSRPLHPQHQKQATLVHTDKGEPFPLQNSISIQATTLKIPVCIGITQQIYQQQEAPATALGQVNRNRESSAVYGISDNPNEQDARPNPASDTLAAATGAPATYSARWTEPRGVGTYGTHNASDEIDVDST
ncbi:hypothetical protein HPB49_023332 [Dermacentor silvarum]|uniref:Uncharacterized protein n=1 Tax=Dermacentor silvarum TaxID=543639 RepID=A0ACB8D852_DERSI|nr:hypothetical protein HPB49_023332 [Dermacentor silvarum]